MLQKTALKVLINRESTQVTHESVERFYNSTHSIDLRKFNYMAGFRVTDNLTKAVKSDPKHVEWRAEFSTSDGKNEKIDQIVRLHPCTKADWKKFNPPSRSAAAMV